MGSGRKHLFPETALSLGLSSQRSAPSSKACAVPQVCHRSLQDMCHQFSSQQSVSHSSGFGGSTNGKKKTILIPEEQEAERRGNRETFLRSWKK